jgi:hypothetical protein
MIRNARQYRITSHLNALRVTGLRIRDALSSTTLLLSDLIALDVLRIVHFTPGTLFLM